MVSFLIPPPNVLKKKYLKNSVIQLFMWVSFCIQLYDADYILINQNIQGKDAKIIMCVDHNATNKKGIFFPWFLFNFMQMCLWCNVYGNYNFLLFTFISSYIYLYWVNMSRKKVSYSVWHAIIAVFFFTNSSIIVMITKLKLNQNRGRLSPLHHIWHSLYCVVYIHNYASLLISDAKKKRNICQISFSHARPWVIPVIVVDSTESTTVTWPILVSSTKASL